MRTSQREGRSTETVDEMEARLQHDRLPAAPPEAGLGSNHPQGATTVRRQLIVRAAEKYCMNTSYWISFRLVVVV